MGSALLSGLGTAAVNGITGMAQQGFSALTSSLFGPSIKKQIKWQKEAQKELNQQAAELNYQYGEKSAENAYNRQMQMYQRSYEDQSYKAMRNQMEEAGLSAGLMYGNGASGGGAGAMSGAPQGETGGAIAGDAAAGAALAIQLKQLENSTKVANAQAGLMTAERMQKQAETIKTKRETNHIDELLPYQTENERQQALGKWLENIEKEIRLTESPEAIYLGVFKNATLDKTIHTNGNSFDAEAARETIREISAQIKEHESGAEAKAAAALLDNTKAREYMTVLGIELKKIAVAAEGNRLKREDVEIARKRVESIARQISLETGDETNWKTWVDLGFKILGGANSAASSLLPLLLAL